MEDSFIIDWLIYKCYEYNRDNNPKIPVNNWEKIFPEASIYEKVYKQKGENYVESNCSNA